MKHYCRESGEQDLTIGCEDCQKHFDGAKSYCGKCWKIVSNKVYLAKNSEHVLGTCNQKHSIPKSIYKRTVDVGCKRSSSYYNERWKARQARYDRPVDEKLLAEISLLEEKNRLLRELLALTGRGGRNGSKQVSG
jgi:hypothetical protein